MPRKKEIKKAKKVSAYLDFEEWLRFRLKYKKKTNEKLRQLIRRALEEENKNG
jgi:hypothetical protein